MDASIAPLSQLLPIGTCLLVEGVLEKPSMQEKHSIELKAERILHIGTVKQDLYPLSKKRLPFETLRDCSHFRPRTTTVSFSSSLLFLFCTSRIHVMFGYNILRTYGVACIQLEINLTSWNVFSYLCELTITIVHARGGET